MVQNGDAVQKEMTLTVLGCGKFCFRLFHDRKSSKVMLKTAAAIHLPSAPSSPNILQY